LNRGRGADRQLRARISFTGPSAHGRSLQDDLGRRMATSVTADLGRHTASQVAAPSPAGAAGPGRLVGRWQINEVGRLVMVWSLEPMVEAAAVIRLTRRKLAAAGGPPPAPAMRSRRLREP
jgi:hypothetical protein